MSSNRLALIQGVTNSFVIDLTDQNGDPVSSDTLTGATASFLFRATPTGSNVLSFTTADPAHLVLDAATATLAVTFAVADTNTLALGPYFYQAELTLSTGEIDVVIPWAPADLTLGGSAAPQPPPFENTVALTENYPLDGDLRYVTPGGTPICGAQIRVYEKTVYDTGDFSSPVGISTTNANGGWTTPVMVAPGYSYVVQFFKPNEFGPDTQIVVGV